MVLKGRISFDRKNLAPYIFRYNVALVCFFAAWFVLCLPPMVAVGCIYGEDTKTYAVMISLFAVFFLGFIIYYIVALKLRVRLVNDCVAQLESEYADMPLEQAAEVLKQRGTINEYGFLISDGGVFGKAVIPFDSAECCVFSTAHGCAIYTEVYIYNFDGQSEICLTMDRALYNFLDKRNLVNLEEEQDFAYLKYDKVNLCRSIFGFKTKKI